MTQLKAQVKHRCINDGCKKKMKNDKQREKENTETLKKSLK